jgi:hypothetical protein
MVPSGADRWGRGRRGEGGAGQQGGGVTHLTRPPLHCSLTGSHTAAHDGERAYNHTHTQTDGRITTDLSRAHQRARSSPPPLPPSSVHSHSRTHGRRRRRRDSSTRAMRNNWFRQGCGEGFVGVGQRLKGGTIAGGWGGGGWNRGCGVKGNGGWGMDKGLGGGFVWTKQRLRVKKRGSGVGKRRGETRVDL